MVSRSPTEMAPRFCVNFAPDFPHQCNRRPPRILRGLVKDDARTERPGAGYDADDFLIISDVTNSHAAGFINNHHGTRISLFQRS